MAKRRKKRAARQKSEVSSTSFSSPFNGHILGLRRASRTVLVGLGLFGNFPPPFSQLFSFSFNSLFWIWNSASATFPIISGAKCVVCFLNAKPRRVGYSEDVAAQPKSHSNIAPTVYAQTPPSLMSCDHARIYCGCASCPHSHQSQYPGPPVSRIRAPLFWGVCSH